MFPRNFAARTGAAVLSLLFFPQFLVQTPKVNAQIPTVSFEYSCEKKEPLAPGPIVNESDVQNSDFLWNSSGFKRGCDRAAAAINRMSQMHEFRGRMDILFFKGFLEQGWKVMRLAAIRQQGKTDPGLMFYSNSDPFVIQTVGQLRVLTSR